MRLNNNIITYNQPYKALATARAIHFAASNGALKEKEARERTSLLLAMVNKVAESIAKKHGVKHKNITFQELGWTYEMRKQKPIIDKT